MDGNIKDTPPIMLVPRAGGSAALGRACRRSWREARKQADGRKQAARADFDKWLATAKPDSIAALMPTDGLRFHAPLSEGKGKTRPPRRWTASRAR